MAKERGSAASRTIPRNGPREPGSGGATVGWMGVTLCTPEDWSPVSVSAEGARGYLRVVSPDTRYLEVRWEPARPPVHLPRVLDGYREQLRRAARRAGAELTMRERPRSLRGVRPREQTPIPYAWEADRRAVGCVWHCDVCNRVVIAEVVGALEDDLTLARDLLASIQDHGEEGPDGERWNTWSLYGLTIRLPERYRLESHTLVTGHQGFRFRDRGSTVRADRWGLAEIALRGTSLRRWYLDREAGTLSRYACILEETTVHGHAALRFHGRDRWFSALLKLARAPLALVWPRFCVAGCVWHCPESNRIYAVMGEQPRRSALIEQVVAGMPCHPRARRG